MSGIRKQQMIVFIPKKLATELLCDLAVNETVFIAMNY